MEKQPVPPECIYAADGDIRQILQRSFSLYLDRVLAEGTEMPYNRHDEWSLIS